MTAAQVNLVKKCSNCEADNYPDAKTCWLCKADVTKVTPTDVKVEKNWPAYVPTNNKVIWTCIVLAFLGAGVVGALTTSEPVVGLLYGIVILPPVIITVVRVQVKQGRGQAVGWGERIATFIISSFATAGVIMMMFVALIIALFAICLVNPPSFH